MILKISSYSNRRFNCLTNQINISAFNIVCQIFNKSIFHLVTEVLDRKSISDLSQSSGLLIMEIAVIFSQILKIDN